MQRKEKTNYPFFPSDAEKLTSFLGKKVLLEQLERMLLIRNFEIRAESSYLQGKIGGFFHSYMGQEAVQTAAILAFGKEQWWVTSYRCHALALLLGCSPESLMAELFGKATGNAMGRGGSMHFFAERLLGGHGIVGGQLPIGTGAAFAVKYRKQHPKLQKDRGEECALCFLGDGAVAQGSFHESLNLASLWDLPCVYVIENNQWGMGTAVNRAISVEPIAEKKAEGFGMKAYTLDGMDFFNCYAGFSHIYEEVKATSRPVLVEVVTERFRGHSISDPGLYRSKEALQGCMERDPIQVLFKHLFHAGFLSEEEFQAMDKAQKQKALEAIRFADESPDPDLATLEKDVFAPFPEELS